MLLLPSSCCRAQRVTISNRSSEVLAEACVERLSRAPKGDASLGLGPRYTSVLLRRAVIEVPIVAGPLLANRRVASTAKPHAGLHSPATRGPDLAEPR